MREEAGARPSAFHVVALGASAGGLRALEEFFDALPRDQPTGLSYVVVSHQAPDRPSLLPELIRRHSTTEVLLATDGTRIEPDRIYVAPPGGTLSLRDGVFQHDPDDRTHRQHPIDGFFRSLAEDRKEDAIAIVLSGVGADGSVGLEAIKREAGLTLAQSVDTATYPGMPMSARATGMVDFILSPTEMVATILSYARNHDRLRDRIRTPEALDGTLTRAIELVRSRTGHDFSLYKPSTLGRRVERRMSVHGITESSGYVRFLEAHPYEADALFHELLIGVTSFFRDGDAFISLEAALEQLIARKPEGEPLRVWIAGCSTGEEPYSIAIVLREALEASKRALPVQMFATDLDPHAIDVARAGTYGAGIAADVTKKRLRRFFSPVDGGYRINDSIREMLIFAVHNLAQDPPFTRLDLLVCRNLLIYLDGALQRHLLALFHYALRPGGTLFLGSSEHLGELGEHFVAVDRHWKIFSRKAASLGQLPRLGPASLLRSRNGTLRRTPAERPEDQANAALASLLPATVLTDERGEIVHVHGRTGAFLEPSEGEPKMNVTEMARDGLRLELTTALRRAAGPTGEARCVGVVKDANAPPMHVEIEVRRVREPESMRGLLGISFRPYMVAAEQPATGASTSQRETELERELSHIREDLQGTVEELQTSNEELQSTNEELQSTNEELETSREEMQSLNEELQTVNAELQLNLDDLSRANDDMRNLLDGTKIATIFLDTHLEIKRFTPEARHVVSLLDTDVGRPLSDLTAKIRYPNLVADATATLQDLVPRSTEVEGPEGSWYLASMVPYHTGRDQVDGVVLTFVDVTRVKRAEAEASANVLSKSIVETIQQPLLLLDKGLCIKTVNAAFLKMFGVSAESVLGRTIYDLNGRSFDVEELRRLLEEILPRDGVMEGYEVRADLTGVGKRRLVLDARRLEQPGVDAEPRILLAFQSFEVDDDR